jgi:hypothetical protein
VVAAVIRQSPPKAAADAECSTWLAGALIMASAYVLPTPTRYAAEPINADERARTDAAAPIEACLPDR